MKQSQPQIILQMGIWVIQMAKPKGGLSKWFKEKWVDTKTGKACGRSEGESRGTPYCRPSKRISDKTPKTSSEMSSAEKRKKENEKTRLGQPKGKPRKVKPVKRKK